MSEIAVKKESSPSGLVIGVSIALAALVSLIVLAFAWPSVTAEAHDLPIAIIGPSQAVDGAKSAVDELQPGAISFKELDSRDAAVDAIKSREVYGAIILGTQPEVLNSSAASAVVSQMLSAIAANLEEGVNAQAAAAAQAAGAPSAPPHIDITVTDVVPLADTDPRGTGLIAALFPLVLGGMIGGIAISLLIGGALRRVVAVVLYAIFGGLALTAILQSWFGALQGDFWLNSAAFALSLAAIAAAFTGLAGLFGRAGAALGAILILLIANPISAAAVPKEFILQPWGDVGQWFPPGAAATLVRDLSYFPSADVLFPWLVLAGWAVVGLLLSLVGHFRDNKGGGSREPEAAQVATA